MRILDMLGAQPVRETLRLVHELLLTQLSTYGTSPDPIEPRQGPVYHQPAGIAPELSDKHHPLPERHNLRSRSWARLECVAGIVPAKRAQRGPATDCTS